ncbi:hypothetical protein CYMTET_22773 [Cymbomonas tetramitiformis]|uniref:Uncharacterized protein n=1 Tax=Cymbomonas tetramitiformis TaxID=36881 RepID=A0AAE0FZT5_9CHLO|nr:hypothetical protein CYMTET_22773 [Cymbomonas tetramitiformis]
MARLHYSLHAITWILAVQNALLQLHARSLQASDEDSALCTYALTVGRTYGPDWKLSVNGASGDSFVFDGCDDNSTTGAWCVSSGYGPGVNTLKNQDGAVVAEGNCCGDVNTVLHVNSSCDSFDGDDSGYGNVSTAYVSSEEELYTAFQDYGCSTIILTANISLDYGLSGVTRTLELRGACGETFCRLLAVRGQRLFYVASNGNLTLASLAVLTEPSDEGPSLLYNEGGSATLINCSLSCASQVSPAALSP